MKTRQYAAQYPGHQLEYCGLICCKGGSVRATPAHAGPYSAKFALPCRPDYAYLDPLLNYWDPQPRGPVTCPGVFGEGWKRIGAYHSHPRSSRFSSLENWRGDVGYVNSTGTPLFMGDPEDDLYRLDPDPRTPEERDRARRRGEQPKNPVIEIPQPSPLRDRSAIPRPPEAILNGWAD